MCVRAPNNSTTSTRNRSLNLIEDAKAMACLLEIAKHFDDLKSAFPQLKHNAKLDFVCKTDNGEYALVEMQVQAQDQPDDNSTDDPSAHDPSSSDEESPGQAH